MRLYNIENIADLDLQDNQELFSVLDYFVPMMKNGICEYISNINGEILLLETDKSLLPIFKADKNYSDAVCISLFSHYIKYIINELNGSNLLKFIFELAGMYFKHNEINKVLYINEWLISTNLHPDLSKSEINNIIKFLTEQYPDYAIVFRNLNSKCNNELMHTLKTCNFKEIVSKQVFILDNQRLKTMGKKYRRKNKSDSKFKKNFSIKNNAEIQKETFSKIDELYKKLYLEKYTNLNPDYTEKYFELTKNSNEFKFDLYENDNNIRAFTMYHCKNGHMAASAIGYDLNLSIKEGLYRLMISDLISKIGVDCEIFNMGAGVGDFKKQRGALPYFEYNAVYYNHLPFRRKLMYKLLELMVDICVPFCCKYSLGGFIMPKN